MPIVTYTLSSSGLARRVTATGGTTQPAQTFSWAPSVDLTPDYTQPIVPGSVRFSLAGATYVDRQGALVANVNPASGAADAAGTVNYSTGDCALTLLAEGAANSGTVQALLTTPVAAKAATVGFRIPAGSIVPGSLTVQWVVAETGATRTQAVPSIGTVDASGLYGTVDHEAGIAQFAFGTRVVAAGNESQPWYTADAVDAEGKIVSPEPALADTIRYAAVAYRFVPLPADIVGINSVRLPSDGRVPIFEAGSVAVVHHTATVAGTYSNGQTVNLGRVRLARVRVRDSAGAAVDAARYTTNLDAGTLTWSNVTGLSQPVTIEHRIEDTMLVSDAQINGLLTFSRPLTHNFPATGAYVSSALLIGDMFARYTGLFEQSTWTGEWSDSRVGTQPLASYNDSLYPLLVTNAGTLTERWAIILTNTTTFRVVGEVVGEIATGNTSTDLAPINPASGQPYFTLDKDGWGTGWAAGNVLRFNTVAASAPVWVARAIQQGPAGADNDSFALLVRGDVDTP